MIKFILDTLPFVEKGKYITQAKGKNKLPTNWKEFAWQFKNMKNG